jgi:Flp pilus assembly protein TadB
MNNHAHTHSKAHPSKKAGAHLKSASAKNITEHSKENKKHKMHSKEHKENNEHNTHSKVHEEHKVHSKEIEQLTAKKTHHSEEKKDIFAGKDKNISATALVGNIEEELKNLASSNTPNQKQNFFQKLFTKKKLQTNFASEDIKRESDDVQSKKNKKWAGDEKVLQTSINRRFQKKKTEKRRITKILDDTLEKSGHEIRGDEFQKKSKRAAVLIGIFGSFITAVGFEILQQPMYFSLTYLILAFIALAGLSYMLILVLSFILLDYQIYQRTREIEEVLPEFLQLASANISAGMPIDRALWFAVRPKFGILAKEIEDVAKSTLAGEDLETALETFTKKYDSKILKESMSLLIEGMRAGGEIGYLLNQIASNMQDIKIMKKEIAASVMSYVIFITVASIIGAPALLALSSQLLVIMTGIASTIDLEETTGSTNSFKIDMSADSISITDFKIFATVCLLFTSVFSAMIISTIRKGNASESIKIIPGYVAVSLIIYFIATAIFQGIMGGLFT